MKELKFNYCIPREYKDENNKTQYVPCRGGEKMNVNTLDFIKQLANPSLPKLAQPWCQVFSNGYRVTNNNLKENDWNGVTFADIDTKLYIEHGGNVNIPRLLEAIHSTAEFMYSDNYYCAYISPSGQGFRVLWYWDCPRTLDNFKKCAILTDRYVKDIFYSFGDKGKEVIEFAAGHSRVLDRCAKSIMQGLFISPNIDIKYSAFTETATYGTCSLDDISLDEAYAMTNVISLSGNISQSEHVKLIKKTAVNADNMPYYPHHYRRCIYEALIVMFSDKKEVDNEWNYVANLIPEQNGHTHEFYAKEPNKNRWYERFNKNILHSLSWLDKFGYVYNDDTEYIYKEQFQKSWKKHCRYMMLAIYKEQITEEYIEENGKDKYKENKEECDKKWLEEFNKHNIFDNYFDEILSKERLERFDEIRNDYYKTRWDKKDFKYLCNGYEIPKDIVTYKMYADFYYRNKDNLPTVQYDILEDEIQVLGYWPETNKVQYHPFKYGNEYTHWKNNDEFSNKCTKTDLLEAVNKYVPRWHNYHVIKDYLNSLDLHTANEELLETWAIRYFKCDDTKLTREICKKFFIAAVKKQMVEKPADFVFQHMLFLQGATGCGKTFFLVNMFTINGHSFILNKVDPNGKDNEIGPLIAKNWLIQFGESESLKKVSVNAAKEFMDRINLGMKYQKKYENEQTTIYPRIMACRTSNDDVLFNDTSIPEGDRRNWLLVCKTPVNACGDELRELMKSEKDVLWATAYKLYLDNPDIDLELSNEAFTELADIQENFKLIKTSDIEETYNEIFERNYLTNDKGDMQDEQMFTKMVDCSVVELSHLAPYYSDSPYIKETKIDKMPARWLSEYVKKKHGVGHWGLLKRYLLEHQWEYKPVRYNGNLVKCFVSNS